MPDGLLQRVISGGQTGVDRAGLDWAFRHGLPIGGFCPEDQRAEDGKVPAQFGLVPLPQGGYRERTEANVLAADGTLILNAGPLDGGTAMTRDFAVQHQKPYRTVQLDAVGMIPPQACLAWLRQHHISCLNIAGPRASKAQGVYNLALTYLDALWRCMAKDAS